MIPGNGIGNYCFINTIISGKTVCPDPIRVKPRQLPCPRLSPLRQELEHFLDCIAGKTGCRTDGHEGIRVLKVLQASEQDIRVNHSYQVLHNANPVLNKTAIVDLRAQQQRLGERIPKAIQKILDHGQYIMGPEVWELEEKLSDFSGARHVITCASGTDALLMALMAHDTGPGDAIFVPSFTFVATAEVVALLGATPVFVDVDTDCFLLDTASLESRRVGVSPARSDTQGHYPRRPVWTAGRLYGDKPVCRGTWIICYRRWCAEFWRATER